jgi:hypothetical protein
MDRPIYKIWLDTKTIELPGKGLVIFGPLDRIIQIAWIIADQDFNIVRKVWAVRKPNGFKIPKRKFRDVTNKLANEVGVSMKHICKCLAGDLKGYLPKTLIGRNFGDNEKNLIEECYHVGSKPMANIIEKLETECTAFLGKGVMEVDRSPRLEELYKSCFNKSMQNQYNAFRDVAHCFVCYRWLAKRWPKNPTKRAVISARGN